MTLEELTLKLQDYKAGSYIRLKWKKSITLKDKTTVLKQTAITARLGLDYGNLPSVKDKPVDPNKEIKPVEWLIKNYVKKSSTGKELLMVYTTGQHKPHTLWMDTNENPISVDSIIDKLYAKDKPVHRDENNELVIMTVDLSNVVLEGGN